MALKNCFSKIILILWASTTLFAEDSLNDPYNPKPDLELIEKIKSLPTNTWMQLPKPNITGDTGWLSKNSGLLTNGPKVRDYCNKIVYAPERKRGIYCGAGHNTHPLNDVWEFDLASNTWICLFAADPLLPRKISSPEEKEKALALTKEITTFKDNVLRTARGGPIRAAHTWWGLAYNSKEKRMVFWDAHKGMLFTNKELLAETYNLDLKGDILKGSGSGSGEAWIFEFDPEKRAWTNVLTGAPKNYESSQLEYISKNDSYFLASHYIYTLNAEKKNWDKKEFKIKSSGAVSAYEPVENKIVIVSSVSTFVYDVATNALKQVSTDNDRAVVPLSTFCYDLSAKKFVLITSVENKEKGLTGNRLSLYDLETNKWTSPTPQGELPGNGPFASYYDANLNVVVFYNNRATWVYKNTLDTK